MEPLHEHILEQYILGRLDEASRQEIEDKIRTDADFAQEYILLRDTILSVEQLGENELKNVFNEVEAELEIDGFFLTGEDIDAYVLEEGTEEENQRLENRQKLDVDFADQIANHADMVKGIYLNGEDELKVNLGEITKELEQEGYFGPHEEVNSPAKIRSMYTRRFWMAVAASILVLVVSIPLLLSDGGGGSTPNLAEVGKFEPYEDKLSEPVRLELSELGMAGSTKGLETLQKGLEAYKLKDYVQSAQFFEEYLNAEPSQHYIIKTQFYLSVSYVGQEKYETAIGLLENLDGNGNFEWKADVQWYLGLAYFKSKEKAKAKAIFEKLKDNNKYKNKVSDLLKVLSKE